MAAEHVSLKSRSAARAGYWFRSTSATTTEVGAHAFLKFWIVGLAHGEGRG